MATKTVTAALLCVCLGLCAQPAFAGIPDPKAASVLDALRKATLSRPLSSISSIHTSGSTEIFGIHGTADEYDDLRGVRYAATIDGGALTGSSGWDGSVAWSQDYSGLVHVDGGATGRLQNIDQAYFDNFVYLRSDYGGATIAYAGKKNGGGIAYDVVAITPPQGSEVELWIDPRTHLIAKETGAIGIFSFTATFSDYRKADGLTYPFRSDLETSTGNSVKTTLSVVRLNEDVAAHITMPASNVHDFAISGGDSATVPLQVINNHLYLHAMVNGQGPYTFILDSGGDYIVAPEVASAIHAKSTGGMQLSGVGNKTEDAGFTRVDSISVGNATVRNQYMLVLPIDTGFGVAEGVHIDGMVGYQLLARFLTTIDYAGGKITFAMPDAKTSSSTSPGTLPFYFDNTIPRIPIGIDGVTTSGEVDTGSRGALTLSSPFVANHPAIAALAKTPPSVEGFGVGGPSYARLGRVHTLQMGPYALSNTITAFGVQAKGALADPFNPANLGGAIWRRFTVTFDYPHQLMTLTKNAAFDTPFSYDRSGLFLIDNKGAYTVISVTPGTPAAAQGLTKGDVIVGINGASASNDSLAELRALLSSPPGTVVHLRVRGTNGERDVALTLQDYV